MVAALTFGGMLGVPSIFSFAGAVLLVMDYGVLGAASFALATVTFFGSVILAWTFILTAKSRLQRAERALYAGDFEEATRIAHFVMRVVFRADFQTGALYTLGLAAERLGAFREAGDLFGRVLGAIPLMAAQGPGRRARSLAAAHAALSYAAAYDREHAAVMLARCYRELGTSPDGGFSFFRMDDSAFGTMGVNAMLNELEGRRDPRALAVLAAALVVHRNGDLRGAADLLARERASVEQGLAAHERALALRLLALPDPSTPAVVLPWVDSIVR